MVDGGGFERWYHSQDSSVVYEARKTDHYTYELRRPGESEPLGDIDAGFFEDVYRREEQHND